MIISFDSKPIFTIDDIQRLLTDERVGVSSPIMVLRGTELVTMEISPAEAP